MSPGVYIFIGAMWLVALVAILLMVRDERKRTQKAMIRTAIDAAAISDAKLEAEIEERREAVDRQFKHIWMIQTRSGSPGYLCRLKQGPGEMKEIETDTFVRIYIGEF
jgi:Flp pilus assembly protein TadB